MARKMYIAAYEDFNSGALDSLIDDNTVIINGSGCPTVGRGEGCRIETPLTEVSDMVLMLGYVNSVIADLTAAEADGINAVVGTIRSKAHAALSAYVGDPSNKVNWVRLVELDSFLFMRMAWHRFRNHEEMRNIYLREWHFLDSWLEDNLFGEAHEYHHEAVFSEESINNAKVYAAKGLAA